MNVYTMVVLIVAIAMFGSVLRARYKAQAFTPVEGGDAARLREEVQRLRDRVAVLERIATDKHNQLEQEFERLRDK